MFRTAYPPFFDQRVDNAGQGAGLHLHGRLQGFLRHPVRGGNPEEDFPLAPRQPVGSQQSIGPQGHCVVNAFNPVSEIVMKFLGWLHARPP